jgi:hypothetical protein
MIIINTDVDCNPKLGARIFILPFRKMLEMYTHKAGDIDHPYGESHLSIITTQTGHVPLYENDRIEVFVESSDETLYLCRDHYDRLWAVRVNDSRVTVELYTSLNDYKKVKGLRWGR